MYSSLSDNMKLKFDLSGLDDVEDLVSRSVLKQIQQNGFAVYKDPSFSRKIQVMSPKVADLIDEEILLPAQNRRHGNNILAINPAKTNIDDLLFDGLQELIDKMKKR